MFAGRVEEISLLGYLIEFTTIYTMLDKVCDVQSKIFAVIFICEQEHTETDSVETVNEPRDVVRTSQYFQILEENNFRNSCDL